MLSATFAATRSILNIRSARNQKNPAPAGSPGFRDRRVKSCSTPTSCEHNGSGPGPPASGDSAWKLCTFALASGSRSPGFASSDATPGQDRRQGQQLLVNVEGRVQLHLDRQAVPRIVINALDDGFTPTESRAHPISYKRNKGLVTGIRVWG